MKFKRLYKNWTFHNLISHPLSEIVFLLTKNVDLHRKLHDFSIPDGVDNEV